MSYMFLYKPEHIVTYFPYMFLLYKPEHIVTYLPYMFLYKPEHIVTYLAYMFFIQIRTYRDVSPIHVFYTNQNIS